MQAIRTVLWVALAVLLALFAMANWSPVTINLWGTLQLQTKLAALVILAFLVGFVPMAIVNRTQRWRYRRRLANAERRIAELTPPAPDVVETTSSPVATLTERPERLSLADL